MLTRRPHPWPAWPLPCPVRTTVAPDISVPHAPSSASPNSSQLATAIAQQGQALLLLVGHLAAEGEALDFSNTALTWKGSTQREKMQTDLSSRSSTYFLQVCQNAHKRLHPALPASKPQRHEGSRELVFRDISGKIRRLQPVQRAGYRLHHAHAEFCSGQPVAEDVPGAREHLALCMASIEQASHDENRWDIAYLLSLLEEPAPQVFA